ncbi:MAG TPA: lamin tail domain-containing protein [Verrucomicrobiae bacterium]
MKIPLRVPQARRSVLSNRLYVSRALGAGLILASVLAGLGASPSITNPPISQAVFIGDPVTFRVGATGWEPLTFQWFRNGSALSGATAPNLGFTAASVDDNARFVVVVTNQYGAVTSAPVLLFLDFGIPGPVQTNRLVEITNVWRYSVGKTNLSASWTAPGYADDTWSFGGGLLYVEESALPAPKTTALALTPGNLPITCYFRTRFANNLTNPYSLNLVANTVIDDGAIFYLNGSAVPPLGMPTAPVSYDTLASRTVGNAIWEGPFDFPATNLYSGTNVLAAEVHQNTTNSTDIVMGLTLDVVWQPRLRDTNAPLVLNVIPVPGATVPTLTQIEVQFDESVRGMDAGDLLINGSPAAVVTELEPDRYVFGFPQPPPGLVIVTWAPGHGIIDRSSNSNAFVGARFSYTVGAPSSGTRLTFGEVIQSSDAAAGNNAVMAVDGAPGTFSLTANLPGSYWLARLGRAFPLERIEVVNRSAPFDVQLAGLRLRLLNLDDQVIYETTLTNPGPGGTLLLDLPPGTVGRSLWIGLPGTQTNGGGTRQVGLAEVRMFGLANLPYGPEPVPVTTNVARVWQSSEYGGYPASNAIDGNASTFTHTADLVDSYWMADLGQVYAIDRIEIVNRSSCCDSRLSGLVLRVFDGASNSIASTVLSNPGLGGTWAYTPAQAISGRWVRVGLENGGLNGDGNHYVTLAEARVVSGTTNLLNLNAGTPVPVTHNLASFKKSYMLRLDETVAPPGNANDDNYATETSTTLRTVDGYWEVDLGATYALYGIRAIGASTIGYRLTNATVRIYDQAHESVHAQRVTGGPTAFDVDLNGPIFGRYVRVGLEDKQRTDPTGGIEFFIGFREVEVFGRVTNNVGVLSFSTSTNQLQPGQSVGLSWAVDDVQRVELRPVTGSVGAYTAANGVGSLTLTPTQSTEFILLATNNAGIWSRALGVQVGLASLPVRLSELVADNKYSLEDAYGEAPDWIELRNTGNGPVDLTGWGLSDEAGRPMKWVFPPAILAPHSTLIIFASGRDVPFDPAGNLHASFRLAKEGGTLILTASDGLTTVDSISHPALDTDLAYGRDLDGNWKLLEPTPRLVNAAPAYDGWLKPIEWSHARGFYDTNFSLTLTNPNPGAMLLYSLDGSEPSLLYTNAISITRTVAARARAVRPGYKSARVQTKTFVFVDSVITSSVMDTGITQDPRYAPRMRPGLLALPSISICVPGQPEYEEREGSLELLWPGGGNPVQLNCGISRFGNAWTKYAKRSIRMKCRARYGEARLSAPLFNGFDRGMLARTSFDELDFRSGSQDMYERGFYMAGRFVEDAMLEMGSLNPHGRYVHLYINGVYWGQYDCREMLVDRFLADYLGGVKEDYVVVRGNDNVGDDFVLGTPDPPNLESWEYARSTRNSYQAVRSYVDVTHLVDFMLLWNYGNAESEFRSCGTVAAGSGFKFWLGDADGFLRTNALTLNRTTRSGPGGLFGGLVTENNSDFKTLLADRVYKHFFNSGALTPSANDARLAARMQEVRDSLVAECARWGYRTPASWESAYAIIRANLFPARTGQLLAYLRNAGLYPALDPPTFNQYGGLVTNGFTPSLASASGPIYYTIDGSDPRLAGGGISPTALVWVAGAVKVTNDLTVRARVRTTAGAWSALAEPRYLVVPRRVPGARDLLVTEINYNPAGSDDFEFVELWNASTNLLDLSGVALSNAVRFIFPDGYALAPGAFLVIAENAMAFSARYQAPDSPYYFDGVTVAGEWVGNLDNAGEIISLVGSNGLEISSVRYGTGGDWPSRPDGKGSSVELAAPPPPDATDQAVRAYLNDGRHWKASSLYHGSPGRFDVSTKSVRINEVLSHSNIGDDWIELFNTGVVPADLTGCTLTDNLGLPARWAFPTNTVIQPGGYLVLSASQLGFAFSELGSDVALLRMTGTNVIRFLDSAELPAANRQESLGIFQRSDGELDFTELRANTPGVINALPRVGPVVFSEIMFQPSPGRAQFVELANITGSSVTLYDPARPTNVWMIEGVGDFVFPPDRVLGPCETMIVCATNAEAFRAQYGVPAGVPVLGPWSGVLDDDGETLKLLTPGTPEADGTVPYYRADHVTYRTNSPWPEVASGTSLERMPIESFGNDPASWRAGPVNGSPGGTAADRPPTIVISGRPVVQQQTPLTLSLAVADLDVPWQTASLQATLLPEGSSFDPAQGTFCWIPSSAQGPGEFTVRFLAADSAMCGANQTLLEFTIQVLKPIAVSAQYFPGVLELNFEAFRGETYFVEYCSDLATETWQLLQEVTAATGGVATVVDLEAGQSPARFYRVRWVR